MSRGREAKTLQRTSQLMRSRLHPICSRNGSAKTNDAIGADNPFLPIPMFGQTETEIPLQTFIDTLSPHGISDLATWCDRCGNTNSRGCELLGGASSAGGSSSSDYASITSTSGKQHVSPVVAGIIGALVGLVLAGLVFGGLGFLGKKKQRRSGYAGGKDVQREGSSYGDMVSVARWALGRTRSL